MRDRREQRLGRGRTGQQRGRLSAASAQARQSRRKLALEALETRQLLAVTLGAGGVIDVSRLPGNQSETAVAINPTNPNNIVIVSNNNAAPGLFEAISMDGGATWKGQTLADGFGVMVPASHDPSVAFDSFGNLFLSYLDTSLSGVVVALSADGGQTFKCITTVTSTFPPNPDGVVGLVDRPRIATGPGSVWVTYEAQPPSSSPAKGAIVATGAAVTGLGADHVAISDFVAQNIIRVIPNTVGLGMDFPDVAVGPTGAVVVTFQDSFNFAGAATIFTSVNPTGLGGNFTPAASTFNTNIGGIDKIPPQSVRGIDAEPRLAYDLSAGPHHGRLYLVYTDSPTISCGCTGVYLSHSDDGGTTWSTPLKVDDNTDDSANFQPSISVDPRTGDVAVAFYSGRNDPGFGPGDRDGHANDDVEMFTALSTDGGLTFSPNVQVSSGPTEAAIAGHNSGQDLGDYTGVAIYNDAIFPAWSDNSTTLQGNPDPNNLDIATARVSILFLIAQGTSLNLITNVPFQGVVASFIDVGPNAASRTAADYKALINWGDGSSSAGTIIKTSVNTYAVEGSHTYTRARRYPITVEITDVVDDRTAVADSTASVKTLPTTIPFAPVLGAGSVVDVNRQTGNQSEPAISVDPLNPLNIVVLSNQNAKVPTQIGAEPIMEAVTFDGGKTWTVKNITDGYGNLVPGFGDPSLSFDRFGNLFLSTLDSTKTLDEIALSTDGGLTFKALTTFESTPRSRNVDDQPTITTGPGTTSPSSVWISFHDKDGSMKAAGAPVYGFGLVGAFGPAEDVPGSTGGNFGDIAIGPEGQVVVTYQVPISDQGPSIIFTNVDPDGLGGAGFGAAIAVPPEFSPLLPNKTTTTFVGGFDPIPAQAERTIDAEAGLAYDRSGGPFSGRLYLVYTDASALESPNTDIYERYSDDDGLSWSSPVRVNDDTTENSQFFPRIAVDPVTGDVGVSWYDARNDPGFGPGDRDGQPNDDVEEFAAVSVDGGVSFSKNVQVASGPSEAAIAGHNNKNDFGDYSALAIYNGVLYPAWVDNSRNLPGNPDPNNFDIATAQVTTLFQVPINGMPNPAQINGVLNGNKLTNNNRPNFTGTTTPGGFVTLFALAQGQTAPIAVGSGFANPQGVWNITSIPLADGTYSFFVTVTDPTGHTSPLVQILPGNGMGFLTIDTVGPVVSDLSFRPLQGQIVLTFQDDRVGLDVASLSNPAAYQLIRFSHLNQVFQVTDVEVSGGPAAASPVTVVVTFNNGRKLRGLDYQLRVLSAAIRDLAGNALDGEFYGYFPSGNRQPGGDFVADLDSVHHTIFPAQPVGPQIQPLRGPFIRHANNGPIFHPPHPGPLLVQPDSSTFLHDLALAQIGTGVRRRHRR